MLTIYRDLYSKDAPNYISLEQCLDRVKSGKQKSGTCDTEGIWESENLGIWEAKSWHM